MTKIPSVEELIKSLPKHYSNVRCSEDNPMVPLSSVKQALQAQRDAGEVRLKTFAENVIEVDKTERYEYSKNDCDRNAKGELAGSGARWSTPKEMAQRILQITN